MDMSEAMDLAMYEAKCVAVPGIEAHRAPGRGTARYVWWNPDEGFMVRFQCGDLLLSEAFRRRILPVKEYRDSANWFVVKIEGRR